jgi:hypothetical protein
MKDMIAHWQKLQTDAVECAMISNLATDQAKRVLFAQLAAQLTTLASEVERVIAAKANCRTN